MQDMAAATEAPNPLAPKRAALMPLVQALAAQGQLANYHLLPSVLADLLARPAPPARTPPVPQPPRPRLPAPAADERLPVAWVRGGVIATGLVMSAVFFLRM